MCCCRVVNTLWSSDSLYSIQKSMCNSSVDGNNWSQGFFYFPNCSYPHPFASWTIREFVLSCGPRVSSLPSYKVSRAGYIDVERRLFFFHNFPFSFTYSNVNKGTFTKVWPKHSSTVVLVHPGRRIIFTAVLLL